MPMQAYTVELEAELNQLKEENNHLKQALVTIYYPFLVMYSSFNWLYDLQQLTLF